jgi:hypothetical protein
VNKLPKLKDLAGKGDHEMECRDHLKVWLILSICRSHICKFVYLIKFMCNSTSTCVVFQVIYNAFSGEKSAPYMYLRLRWKEVMLGHLDLAFIQRWPRAETVGGSEV